MADYDVGAVGLSSPPSPAVITTYRPAVSVRNNGIHDALAYGTLRIYSAGLLIFSTEIYSGTISPGETKPAQAIDYWQPPAFGTYQVIAYVTCDRDQFERNNSLPPTLIHVTTEPPPPPPVVAIHAAQHEDGGDDELNIDGLHGRVADAQPAMEHRSEHQAGGTDQIDVTGLHGLLADGQPTGVHKLTHQDGGTDELNVDGLRGVLAQGQPIADHHPTHEDDGDDELNVDGLRGVLYNKQKPQTHANEAHDPNYAPTPHSNTSHDPKYVSEAVLAAHVANPKTHGTEPNAIASEAYATHWTGQWLAAVQYEIGHIVTDAGATYACILRNKFEKPPDPTYWQPLPGGVHGNEVHTQEFATDADLKFHADTAEDVHRNALTLEQRANRGAANGYAPLDGASRVPLANTPKHGWELHERHYTAWRGAWHELIQYVIDDIVNHQGNLYVCVSPNINKPPPDPSNWVPWPGGPHGNELHTEVFAVWQEIVNWIIAQEYETLTKKGQPNGYAPLNGDAKVPVENLPPIPPGPHGNEMHTSHYIDWVGLWIDTQEYVLGNVVRAFHPNFPEKSGLFWCGAVNTGKNPWVHPEAWEFMHAEFDEELNPRFYMEWLGVWEVDRTYHRGNFVVYITPEVQGLFICLAANSGKYPPDWPDYWYDLLGAIIE